MLRNVIEVKGCWNSKVRGNLKDQLIDKYLFESSCKHGIYLIVFFGCSGCGELSECKSWIKNKPTSEIQNYFQKQSELYSIGGLRIEPFILNAALIGK